MRKARRYIVVGGLNGGGGGSGVGERRWVVVVSICIVPEDGMTRVQDDSKFGFAGGMGRRRLELASRASFAARFNVSTFS
jgi:hypothetical protein